MPDPVCLVLFPLWLARPWKGIFTFLSVFPFVELVTFIWKVETSTLQSFEHQLFPIYLLTNMFFIFWTTTFLSSIRLCCLSLSPSPSSQSSPRRKPGRSENVRSTYGVDPVFCFRIRDKQKGSKKNMGRNLSFLRAVPTCSVKDQRGFFETWKAVIETNKETLAIFHPNLWSWFIKKVLYPQQCRYLHVPYLSGLKFFQFKENEIFYTSSFRYFFLVTLTGHFSLLPLLFGSQELFTKGRRHHISNKIVPSYNLSFSLFH